MQTSAHTKLERAQVLLNHQFKTTDYLWEALQCAGSGVLFSGARFIPDGNKRLAIIGDKLIGTEASPSCCQSAAGHG